MFLYSIVGFVYSAALVVIAVVLVLLGSELTFLVLPLWVVSIGAAFWAMDKAFAGTSSPSPRPP